MAKDKYEDLVLPRLEEIKTWTKEGYFEKDIITLLGIGKTSWEKYKNEHCELSDLLKKSKQESMKDIEPKAIKSLIRLVEGFHEYDIEKTTKETKAGKITTEKVIKRYYPPNPTMIIYALKVVNSYKWSDNKLLIDLKQKMTELAERESDKKF